MVRDKDFFRTVMGQFATGVTIATTRGQAGVAGLTVNSFTSVSLDPLLVLICVDLRSHALPFFRESGIFAVNILSQDQEALSNCFASSSEERYNYFCHAGYSKAATGAPILAGTLAFVDARITAEYPGGDHVIFVGEVEAMGYDGQVVLLPGITRADSTLPDLISEARHANHNGHGKGTSNEQGAHVITQPSLNGHHIMADAHTSPLLYYRGEYHHLSHRYHHEHPELAPTAQNHHEPNS